MGPSRYNFRVEFKVRVTILAITSRSSDFLKIRRSFLSFTRFYDHIYSPTATTKAVHNDAGDSSASKVEAFGTTKIEISHDKSIHNSQLQFTSILQNVF